MLHQIDYGRSMFTVVKRPYTVAKSLYFMLTQDYLSKEEQISAIEPCYFCLLKNYLMNKDCKMGESEYEDLVSGSKLALVLLSIQKQFLSYAVIAKLIIFIYQELPIRNQFLLFAGIAKEADNANCVFPLEDVINGYYEEIDNDLTRRHIQIPNGRALELLKESCTPLIIEIEKNLGSTLQFPRSFFY